MDFKLISMIVTFSVIFRLNHDKPAVSGGRIVISGENHSLTPCHWQFTHMPKPKPVF